MNHGAARGRSADAQPHPERGGIATSQCVTDAHATSQYVTNAHARAMNQRFTGAHAPETHGGQAAIGPTDRCEPRPAGVARL